MSHDRLREDDLRRYDPSRWATLYATCALFAAMRHHLGDICRLKDDHLVARVLAELADYAGDAPVTRAATPEAAFEALWTRWAAGLPATASPGDPGAGDRTPREQARDVMCRVHAAVRSAQPVDALTDLFDRVTHQTLRVYSSQASIGATPHAAGSAARRLPEQHDGRHERIDAGRRRHDHRPHGPRDLLIVQHLAEHPRRATVRDDPFVATAATQFVPSATRVVLSAQVETFGVETFAAVTYLLIHESVCHVATLPHPVSAAWHEGERGTSVSSFSEGFMDWAALYFLDVWAGKLYPGETRVGAVFRRYGRRLAHQLMDAGSAEAGARLRGHAAAEAVLEWLIDHRPETARTCQARVVDLALELNLVDAAPQLKDRFVSVLDDPESGWGLHPRVQDLLAAWVDRRIDAGTLLRVVTSLDTTSP